MKIDIRLALAAVLAMASVAAFGQDAVRVVQSGQGTAVSVRTMMDALSMASRKDVQAELKLSSDQQSKIAELAKSIRPVMVRSSGQISDPVTVSSGGGDVAVAVADAGSGAVVTRTAGAMKIDDESETEQQLASILTKPQQTRLSEIEIQLQGYMSVARPAVQSALGMSDEQIAALKSVLSQPVGIHVFASGEDAPDPKQIKAQLDEQRQQRDAAIASILSRKQQAQLVALGGKKFVPSSKEEEATVRINRVINP